MLDHKNQFGWDRGWAVNLVLVYPQAVYTEEGMDIHSKFSPVFTTASGKPQIELQLSLALRNSGTTNMP